MYHRFIQLSGLPKAVKYTSILAAQPVCVFAYKNGMYSEKETFLSTLFDNQTSFAFSVFYFGYAFFCKNGLKIKMLIKLTVFDQFQ